MPIGIIGGIASGIGSIFGASKTASAATQAANTQAAAANNATALQQQALQQTTQNLAPFLHGGTEASQRLAGILGLDPTNSGQAAPSLQLPTLLASQLPNISQQPTYNLPAFTQQQFQQSPGYQYQLQQAQNATRNAATPGQGAFSGATLKALQSNASGLANQDWYQALNNYTNNYNTQYGQNANNLLNQYNAGTQNVLDVYNANTQQQTAQYNANNQNYWSNLAALSNLGGAGQNAAAQLGGFGTTAATNAGQNAIGAGNAIAAGQIGNANAIVGGINSLTGNLLSPTSATGGGASGGGQNNTLLASLLSGVFGGGGGSNQDFSSGDYGAPWSGSGQSLNV